MNPNFSLAFASAAAIGTAGCSRDVEAPAPVDPASEVAMVKNASADLVDAEGRNAGSATITESGGILLLDIKVTGVPRGLHGAHIHTTGQCTLPDFASAGGHWNPGNMNHGTESDPPNPHAGDLPNIEVAENGTGILQTTAGGSFAELLDRDGAALVIHADPDDYLTQPAGNSGVRIACGVFRAS